MTRPTHPKDCDCETCWESKSNGWSHLADIPGGAKLETYSRVNVAPVVRGGMVIMDTWIAFRIHADGCETCSYVFEALKIATGDDSRLDFPEHHSGACPAGKALMEAWHVACVISGEEYRQGRRAS